MIATLFTAMAALVAWSLAAVAQEQNVQALLSAGYRVVGTIPSPAGPALFLQKDDKLVFCVIAETTTSPDVATRYCKPVR